MRWGEGGTPDKTRHLCDSGLRVSGGRVVGGGGGVSSPMLLPQIWHYWTLSFKNNTEFKRCDVCHAGLSHELKYILSYIILIQGKGKQLKHRKELMMFWLNKVRKQCITEMYLKVISVLFVIFINMFMEQCQRITDE